MSNNVANQVKHWTTRQLIWHVWFQTKLFRFGVLIIEHATKMWKTRSRAQNNCILNGWNIPINWASEQHLYNICRISSTPLALPSQSVIIIMENTFVPLHRVHFLFTVVIWQHSVTQKSQSLSQATNEDTKKHIAHIKIKKVTSMPTTRVAILTIVLWTQ